MDAFDFDDNVMKPKISPSWVRAAKKLFRITETILILVLLKWLPSAVRISGEYFRQIISVIISNLFVFLLGNLIVLTLFFKCRRQNLQNASDIDTHLDLCQEFIDGRTHFTGERSPPPEEIVYEDKETILEVTKVKLHRRSQSENLRRVEEDHRSCGKQLRRRRLVVDELSNEEFQRAIEAFIAKQIKFHQQEKLAIVVHGT